jgi:cytidylate kinase
MRPADIQMRFRALIDRGAPVVGEEYEKRAELGPFLTISRQADSGGAEVARRVGIRLGWAVFDRELVEDVSRRLELEPRMLDLMDETRSNWFNDTLLNLLNSRLVLQDSYVAMVGRVMLMAACEGRVIFVGRGGHILLPRNSGLRVRVVAPRADRLARLCAREGLDADRGSRRLDQLDASRADFVRRHFKAEPDDASLYDLVVDTASFHLDGAVDLICRALHLRSLA